MSVTRMAALRTFRREDLDAMYALDCVCFEPRFRFSRAAMRRFALAGNALVTVAAEGEALAGFCVVHVEDEIGYVVTLDVDPGWRRRGVAGMLMEAAEAQALAAGCEAVVLHVFVGNAGSVRFYEAGGYARVGSEKGFYAKGVDAWVYRKGTL